MKRRGAQRHFLILCALTCTISPVQVLAGPTPVKAKRQIQIVRTECLVAATESKRIAPNFAGPERPDPYSRELWALLSENVNTVTIGGLVPVNVLDLFNIDKNRDVLANGAAPSGVGWRPQFKDTEHPDANQRHHYAFHFFSTANDGGMTAMADSIGVAINELNDFVSGNEGDLSLSTEAQRQGTLARSLGVKTTSGQIKGVLCAP